MMRRRPKHIHRLLAVLAVVGLPTLSTAESAESAESLDSLDWSPSFALGVLAHVQNADATTTTSWVNCAPIIPFDANNGPGCFAEGRAPSSGTPDLTAGIPDLRLALYGPSLDFLSERVRPYVHMGWQYGWRAFETEVVASQEGNFGNVLLPADTNLPVNVQGVGTLINTDVEDGWFAGIGLAIELPSDEVPMRLLPSLDYYGQRFRLEGASRRVAERVADDPPGLGTRAEFRIEEVRGSEEKTLHALGPRLGLEVDIGQRGSIALSGFLEVGAFFFLGDRELTIDAMGDGMGRFSIRHDPVAFHGGGGVRLAWRPGRRPQ